MMVGRKIRRAREARGISTRELAREAKISTETVYSIEHGKRVPSLRTLQKIARALSVDVKDLL